MVQVKDLNIMANWQKQLKEISMALAVIGGLWMVAVVGIGDALNIVTDPAAVDTQTAADLGGIDFIDRVAVAGIVVTLVSSAGLGLISTGSGNPPFVNQILRYYPLIIGFVALSAFSTEVFDTISGNRDWSSFSDVQNSYMLFLAGSLTSGIASLLMNRKN